VSIDFNTVEMTIDCLAPTAFRDGTLLFIDYFKNYRLTLLVSNCKRQNFSIFCDGVAVRCNDNTIKTPMKFSCQINFNKNRRGYAVPYVMYLYVNGDVLAHSLAVEKITYHPSPNPNAVITLQLGE